MCTSNGLPKLVLAVVACLLAIGVARAEVIGPPLIDRPGIDGASNYMFLHDDGTPTPGFTTTGVTTTWSFFNNNGAAQGGRTLEPLLLKKVGSNWIITGVGASVTTPATMSGVQTFGFNLVEGSSVVGPGYSFAHHDLANPGSIEYTNHGTGSGIGTHRYYGLSSSKGVVGRSIADGSFSGRDRTYSVQFTTDQQLMQTSGDALVDRVNNDGANGAIFAVPDGVFSGRVTEWAFFDDDDNTPDRQVTPLVLERLSASQYRIVGIGTTRTTKENGEQHHMFGLVAGSDGIGPGRFFGWKDGSNGTNNQGVIDWNDDPAVHPDRILYFGAGHTSFAVNDALGVSLTLDRSYSVRFADTIDGQIVGDDLINRPNNDGANGGIFVSTDPLGGFRLAEWAFFDNDGHTPDRQVTPLLLEQVGANYLIRGIGTTRTADESGQQSFDFDLIAGTDLIGPDFFFAWKDGSLLANNPGAIDWSDNFSSTDGIRYFGTGHAGNVYAGRDLGSGKFYGRDYSVQAYVLIPEPTTLALLGLGGLTMLRRRRAARAK